MRTSGHRRSLLLSACVVLTVFFMSVPADAAASAKRKRRSRPSSRTTTEESSTDQTRAPTGKKQTSDGAGHKGSPASLDDQINTTQAELRKLRRSISDAVKGVNLNGTMIFIPSGSAEGLSVDFTSKHAGKVVRGKIRATGRGSKARATISASRAK